MVLSSFKNSVRRLEDGLASAIQYGINIKEESKKEVLYDFKTQKMEVCKKSINSNLENINQKIWELMSFNRVEEDKPKLANLLNLIEELNEYYENTDLEQMLKILGEIKQITNKLSTEEEQNPLTIKIPQLPTEIREEITADMNELKKCYTNCCYRSVVIICGRILEAALHRKYYESTGFDILEKNPGIGLGKLVAKLVEKNIKLDPGLTQQIHLINQIRIFSVHKKKAVFYPTKAQAQAIILYTTDVICKLFQNGRRI